jgi:outer membrane protein TolC
MRDRHEPSEEFVEKLEWQLGREVRQRNRAARAPRWSTWSPAKAFAAVAGLMLVSMVIGGAVVAAAYEAQSNERRDQLAANFEQRVDLAKKRLALVTEDVKNIEQRVSMGVATNTDLLESRIKVADAEAQLNIISLQLEEVRLTGREPRLELSSPLVSGRDYVGQRLRFEMSVPEKRMALETARLKDAQRKFEVGVATSSEVEAARNRLLEVQAALETMQTKIAIRQRFLSGGVDAALTELRVLEAEADQLKKTLTPKVVLARKDVTHIEELVAIGMAQRVELAEAILRRMELETALSKAELDLAVIQNQIQQHRAGK